MIEDKNLPKWLIKTQHNSWEPEIFISGIVLFGLIQLPEYLNEFRYYYSREIYGFSSDADNVVAVLTTGIYWMIFGLVLHLFVRGIWIGLVGLSYVFPKGINQDKLGYPEKYDKIIGKIPHVTDQIIKLEKVSSSIFSINYLMFMCVLSAYLFILLFILLPIYGFFLLTDFEVADMFDPDGIVNQMVNGYARSIMVVGGVYMFDFVTVGLVKRIKYVNVVYYPIYRVISFITFSKLYRNIYYLLISNFKKWKVITFLIVFSGISLFMISLHAGRTSLGGEISQLEFYDDGWRTSIGTSGYDNMNADNKNVFTTIQSDIIHDNALRLFISSRIAFKDSIRQVCDPTIEDKESGAYKLACLKNFYILSIDDSVITNHQWYFHQHRTSKNKGIITYLDISTLENGMHEIKIDLKNFTFKEYSKIPFFLDR